MSRPVRKRLGHSRKAHYSLITAYLLASVGSVAGFLLALISVVDPSGFAMLRMAGHEIAAPMVRTLRWAGKAVSGVDDSIGAYIRAGKQNQELKRIIAENRQQLITAQRLVDENRRLRGLLQLAERDTRLVATGYLLSSTPTSTRRTAVLSVGRNKAVQKYMVVRTADGLIGRVLNSGLSVARVLLLSDSRSAVPVRRAQDGLPAVTRGLGDGRLEVQTLTVSYNPFNKGDVMVTSGVGGIYPPNIPVAVIVERIDDGAIAQPLAIPASSDIVSVLSVYTMVPPLSGSARASDSRVR